MNRLWIILVIVLTGCSTAREVVMPFRNYALSGDKLFPVESNESEFTFRIWINNGTSVDRVISVSRDSIFGDQCKFFELGFLNKKGIFKTKKESIFKEELIEPACGFDNLIIKIDSLNLFDYKSQTSFEFLLNHRPISLYSVEIKENGKYNQFTFRTYFPDTTKVSQDYERIQRLIFNEFRVNYYMKE
jgi:hypothetical protein